MVYANASKDVHWMVMGAQSPPPPQKKINMGNEKIQPLPLTPNIVIPSPPFLGANWVIIS